MPLQKVRNIEEKPVGFYVYGECTVVFIPASHEPCTSWVIIIEYYIFLNDMEVLSTTSRNENNFFFV